MIKKWKHAMRSSAVFNILTEFALGFSMAVATFLILPLSIDLIGLIPALFGLLTGILLFLFADKRKLKQFFLFQVILFSCLVGWFINPFLFDSYWKNGIFHSVFVGVFLSYQADILSHQRKFSSCQKKGGISYLLGLVLGILLK